MNLKFFSEFINKEKLKIKKYMNNNQLKSFLTDFQTLPCQLNFFEDKSKFELAFIIQSLNLNWDIFNLEFFNSLEEEYIKNKFDKIPLIYLPRINNRNEAIEFFKINSKNEFEYIDNIKLFDYFTKFDKEPEFLFNKNILEFFYERNLIQFEAKLENYNFQLTISIVIQNIILKTTGWNIEDLIYRIFLTKEVI